MLSELRIRKKLKELDAIIERDVPVDWDVSLTFKEVAKYLRHSIRTILEDTKEHWYYCKTCEQGYSALKAGCPICNGFIVQKEYWKLPKRDSKGRFI